MSASNALPFASRVLKTGARDIIARDRARAQKLLAGVQPHGPAAFHSAELRKRGAAHPQLLSARRHGHHHHHETEPTDPAPTEPGKTPTAPGDNTGETIDVTDAGACVRDGVRATLAAGSRFGN